MELQTMNGKLTYGASVILGILSLVLLIANVALVNSASVYGIPRHALLAVSQNNSHRNVFETIGKEN